jgi:dihydroorotate dehydrogenase
MFLLIRQLLFKLSPENAHHFTMKILSFMLKIPRMYALLRMFNGIKNKPKHNVVLAGISFPNPVGLAAGFDKNAKYLHVWKALGFGSVEIGTITPKAQDGNPQPRLFRLPSDMALINRLGFNNEGLDAAVSKLKKRPQGLIVGGNIGKNKVTPNDKAADDYMICFEALYDLVDYFTINVSSPNTPGLRDLQSIKELELIVKPILEKRKKFVASGKNSVPVFVKFAPDLESEQLTEIMGYVNSTDLEGVVLTNTTLDRSGLKTSKKELDAIGAGGLSGMPLTSKSTQILEQARQLLVPQKAIIGVGGIFNGKDAMAKKEAGASLIQVYTGFVYKGPGLIGSILKLWR